MIISHKHKFIFLKTNKTASTSIEIALSTFCGEKDIITPINPNDEKIRQELGHRGPQNYLLPLRKYSFRELRHLLLKGKRKQFYHHIPAREIMHLIGEKRWHNYFKFCFERNPWDRVISYYYWSCKSEPRPPISEFIDSGGPKLLKKRGFEMYTVDGRIAVDKVCLYEKLEEELEKVSNILGFGEKLILPRAKASYRKDRRHYREILDEKDKAKIAAMFQREIELFGYEF
jgi:hypothetical protein